MEDKVSPELRYLKSIEERNGACATCIEGNHGIPERKAKQLILKDVPWLIERLLEFMQIASQMRLNQKDNDEGILNNEALKNAQRKITKPQLE